MTTKEQMERELEIINEENKTLLGRVGNYIHSKSTLIQSVLVVALLVVALYK
jgi:hypothetical protein